MLQATFQGKRWDHEVASTAKWQMSLADIGEGYQGCPLYPQEADILRAGINVR